MVSMNDDYPLLQVSLQGKRLVRRVNLLQVIYIERVLQTLSGTIKLSWKWQRRMKENTCFAPHHREKITWIKLMLEGQTPFTLTRTVQRNAWREVADACIYEMMSLITFAGCSSLWAIDGNWKLHYPVCMYQLPLQTQAFKGNLKYVNTCPQSPVHGMAFCQGISETIMLRCNHRANCRTLWHYEEWWHSNRAKKIQSFH